MATVTLTETQTQRIADALSDVGSAFDALGNEVVYGAADTIAIQQRLHEAAAGLTTIAETLTDDSPEDDRFADDDEEFAEDSLALPELDQGTKLPLRYPNGKRVRVGDRVQVFNSDRYGDPTGVVIGAGDDIDDGKGQRIRVRLDGGQNDDYHPSLGRVQRISRAREPVQDVMPS
jgi:hypothetical protein